MLDGEHCKALADGERSTLSLLFFSSKGELSWQEDRKVDSKTDCMID